MLAVLVQQFCDRGDGFFFLLRFRSDRKEELESAYREINTLRSRIQQLEQENAFLRQQLEKGK